ncbi:MAG: chorismate synthase [Bacteroidales bacterium]|jgi:chorismate synthase|nr:chorismate synthase [Bacteroidales bacterium]
MNTFGQLFRITIFGESHGSAIGVVVDGCPPGITISSEDLLPDLKRRQSGGRGTTPRMEADLPEILSGIHENHTTGAPITIITRNGNHRSSDYDLFRDIPRPGHADYVARIKYAGFADMRGSGHFSGRITWGLVAAGAIAKKIVTQASITASLISAGGLQNIDEAVEKAIAANNSVGGIVECRVANPPIGLGEPFFYSFESALSQLIFSIPAIRGIEFGAGFAATSMTGLVHNDAYTGSGGQTTTNNSGGVNGGITNGNEIVFRIAVKPTSSIGARQDTYNFKEQTATVLHITGRHDACIALRVPVIAEAAAAIVLADLVLIDRSVSGKTHCM